MLYCSWDMVSDRCNCYFSLCYFLPFYLPNSPKNENFKTMKKMPGDIIILQKFTKNNYHMLYSPWDMTHDTSFPLTAKKKKNRKNEKNSWTYHHFTQVYQKLWLNNVHFLRYGAWQTDRQMVGKSEIDPPKNRKRQF